MFVWVVVGARPRHRQRVTPDIGEEEVARWTSSSIGHAAHVIERRTVTDVGLATDGDYFVDPQLRRVPVLRAILNGLAVAIAIDRVEPSRALPALPSLDVALESQTPEDNLHGSRFRDGRRYSPAVVHATLGRVVRRRPTGTSEGQRNQNHGSQMSTHVTFRLEIHSRTQGPVQTPVSNQRIGTQSHGAFRESWVLGTLDPSLTWGFGSTGAHPVPWFVSSNDRDGQPAPSPRPPIRDSERQRGVTRRWDVCRS